MKLQIACGMLAKRTESINPEAPLLGNAVGTKRRGSILPYPRLNAYAGPVSLTLLTDPMPRRVDTAISATTRMRTVTLQRPGDAALAHLCHVWPLYVFRTGVAREISPSLNWRRH